jgi:hypothetical protein
LQSLPSTYLNCHEQISSFPSDRIILPFMSPKRASAWMACNSIRISASLWLLNKSGQSLTFEGVKFFVVDGSENKPAR